MSLLSLSMRVTDRAECMHIGKNAPAFISEQNAHNRGEEMVFSRSNIHTNTIFFLVFTFKGLLLGQGNQHVHA